MTIKKSLPTPPRDNDLIIPHHERKTVTTLLCDDCRWPIGDPQHRDFHFCGKRKLADYPYCELHTRMSFQAKQTKYRPYTAGER